MGEAWIIDAARTPRGIGKFGQGARYRQADSVVIRRGRLGLPAKRRTMSALNPK